MIVKLCIFIYMQSKTEITLKFLCTWFVVYTGTMESLCASGKITQLQVLSTTTNCSMETCCPLYRYLLLLLEV